MAARLPAWREPEAILELAELGVAEREGVRRASDRSSASAGAPRRRGAGPVLRHAAHRHLLLAGPRGASPPACRCATSCPTPSPATSQRDGLYRMSGAAATEPEGGRARRARSRGFAADKKAIDVVELDLRGVLGYTDYFLICSGNTDRQTKAIHDGIHQGLKKDHGLLPRRVEGLGEARWILMDYLDVVVHVFTPEARDFYRLEQLWGEAPERAVADESA